MTDDHYTESFRIRASETDPRGRLSILAIADYMQEMAGWDARRHGFAVDQLFARGLTWVLARLRIRLDSTPRWLETITGETWPSSADARGTTRDFRFRREDGTPAIVATTAWRILDLETRRPVPTLPGILALIGDEERALTFEGPPIVRPKAPDWEVVYDVRKSDLDINRHVNNVVYLDWALEPVPLETWRDYEPAEVELSFRSEGRLGDRVICRAQRVEGGDAPVFTHQVVREADGREMAAARSVWRRI